MDRFSLLVKTARRKTLRQIVGVLNRKARNRVVPRLPVDVDGWYRRQIPTDVTGEFRPHGIDTDLLREALSTSERRRYENLAEAFLDGQVTFLNRNRSLPNFGTMSPDDEQLEGLPRLWYLKLVAFEPILWGILAANEVHRDEFIRTANEWIDRWSREEPIGSRDGYLRGFWTPYAVSLRIITLCRYAAWGPGLDLDGQRFLFKNLLFLERNVEHDVGGNHLFENGTALVLGGVAFRDHSGRFLHRGLQTLETAVDNQFLDDGYHFERSPMYHLAVTERLVTTLSVLQAAGLETPEGLLHGASKALGFAAYLTPPDNRIPLLNDAVFDETHSIESVRRYGESVGVDAKSPGAPRESELAWFSAGSTTLLFDAGDSGPTHLLGHIHNDPGTLVLWMDDTRMITDTGTFDYQPGRRRMSARSIRAHNTVQVGEEEPADFGGRFRMADSIETKINRWATDDGTAITMSYRAGAESSYRHLRTVFAGNEWLAIRDCVDHETPGAVSRLHAHPSVTLHTDPAIIFEHESGEQLELVPYGVEVVTTRTAPYFPEFGVEHPRSVLELKTNARRFGYVLVEPGSDVDVANQQDRLTITHDGTTHTLPRSDP